MSADSETGGSIDETCLTLDALTDALMQVPFVVASLQQLLQLVGASRPTAVRLQKVSEQLQLRQLSTEPQLAAAVGKYRVFPDDGLLAAVFEATREITDLSDRLLESLTLEHVEIQMHPLHLVANLGGASPLRTSQLPSLSDFEHVGIEHRANETSLRVLHTGLTNEWPLDLEEFYDDARRCEAFGRMHDHVCYWDWSRGLHNPEDRWWSPVFEELGTGYLLSADLIPNRPVGQHPTAIALRYIAPRGQAQPNFVIFGASGYLSALLDPADIDDLSSPHLRRRGQRVVLTEPDVELGTEIASRAFDKVRTRNASAG